MWKYWEKDLTAYYISSVNKPTTHTDLIYAFTDKKGKKYYTFPEKMALSVDRWGELQKYLTFMSSALTGEELDEMIDVADKALTEGLLQKKNASKIGAILHEIRQRRDMVIHTELVYNYLAVQYIREDELPDRFNNVIQMEKVDQFKEEDNKFFFALPELKKLQDLFQMSEQEWIKYWKQSQMFQKAGKEAMKIYL